MTHGERQAISTTATVLLLAVFFGLLTLAYTYPIWTAPDTLLNELADVRLIAWIMAWDAHALLRAPASLFDANAFFPYRDALALSENMLGTALLVAPINWAGHPVLAYNVVFLLSFVLSGIGMALWVRRLSGSTAAAMVAGVMWAFAPARTDHLPHLQVLAAPWIPFAMLALTRYAQQGLRRDALLAAALLALQYASGLNMALIALPFAVLYVAFLLLTAPALPGSLTRPRLAVDGALAGAILGAVVAPLSVPYLRVREAFGFERSLDEMVHYSAQMKSYLSPGWVVKAPHMRALYDTFRLPEANYFPGYLAAALGLLALALLLPAAVRGRWPGLAPGEPPEGGGSRARRWLHRLAMAVTLAAGLLHAGGLAVAFWWSRPESMEWVLDANRTLRPTIWLAIAGAVAVASWAPPTAALRPRAFAVLSYLAMLAYLLSLGPLVSSWGFALGEGPYRVLYELVTPYRSIRSVGRFGLEWAMLWAALGGLGVAAALEAMRRRMANGALGTAVALLLAAGIAWECRTWPIQAEDARPPDAEIYEHLATLPAGSSVLHVPVIPRGEPWRVTEYMLASTRHWLPIVNGYSGFLPGDLVTLAGLDPFSEEFVQRVRSDYPVDYLVFHGGKLGGRHFDEQTAPILVHERPDLELVRRLDSPDGEGHALIFALRRSRDSGQSIRRRYTATEFDAAVAVQMEARLSRRVAAERRLHVVWEGVEARGPTIGGEWTPVRVPKPDGAAPRPDGTAWISMRLFREQSLGDTGATLQRELLLDVHASRAALALDDSWDRQSTVRGILAFEVLASGNDLEDAVAFDAESGVPALRAFLEARPAGRIVAVAVNTEQPLQVTAELAATLGRLGASVRAGELLRRYALVGAVGAPPGSSVEHENPSRAFVRVGPAPLADADIVVRGLRLVNER